MFGRVSRQQLPGDLLPSGDIPKAALSGRPCARLQITRMLLP